MASLPQVGVQAVVLGMAAFNANAKSVETQINRMGAAAFRLERATTASFGASATAATAFGAVMATVAATLVATAAAAVVAGQKYERALKFTGAVAGATTQEVMQLRDVQYDLASTTTSSAGAVNEMSAELLKAGQSMESVLAGSLKATNDLVVASNGELRAADAAVLMQVAMEGFGVTAVRAADATTAAVQRSTLTFGEFADAIRQGGANAANAGLTFDEFSTVIGVMGLTINSGSEAATSLRVMLQRLQNPTEEATALLNKHKISLYDSTGAARDFRDVIADLSREFDDNAVKTGKVTQAERDKALAIIFGQRASKGAIALIRQGTAEYDKMLAAVENNNTAQNLARELLKSSSAQMDIMRNRTEVLGLAFNEGLEPYINKATSSMLKWLQSLDYNRMIAFGDTVGGTVYNAFANFGNLLSAEVTPKMNVFQTAVYTMVGVIIALAGRLALTWALTAAGVAGSMMLMASRAATAAAIIAAAYLRTAIPAVLAYAAATTASMAAATASIIAGMIPALATFAAAIGAYIGPILLIVAAVAATIALVKVAWENNWFDMQDAVKSAIEWMQPALSSFFNWFGAQVNNLFKSLSQIMEESDAPRQEGDIRKKYGGKGFDAHFTSVAAPAVAAVKKVGAALGDAGNAAKQLGEDAIAAFSAIKDFKIPSQHDFAGDVLKAWSNAAADRAEAMKPSGGAPAGEPSEAGEYPTDADEKAAKDAAKKLEAALAKADELIEDFNDDINKSVSGITTDVIRLYTDAFGQVNDALAEHEEAVTKAMEESGKAVKALFDQQDLQNSIEARKKALEDTLKFEEDWRAQHLADGELWHQRQLEDDKRYYDALRKLREDAFDQEQEAAARARALTREDEDIAYQAGLDAREATLAAKQDIDERGFQQELDAREATLKGIQDLEERSLKQSQDRRERALRAILDAEKLARNQAHDLTKLEAEDARDRAAAQAEYQKQIGLGIKASIAKTRLDEALDKISKKTTEDRAKLTDEHAWEKATDAFDAGQQSRMDALKADFDTEDLALQAKHNSEKLALDKQLELDKTAFANEQERVRNELRDTLDREARQRAREREVEDRLFAEQQEREKNQNTAKEDAKAVSDARTLEDKERERKRKNDLADAAFKAEQDEKRKTLEKQLEAEDLQRRIDNIHEEERQRLDVADRTLREEQQKIRTKLAQDIIDLRENMSERIATIKENYTDRLDDIMDDANIGARASEVTNTIAMGLYAIRDAAQAATDKLAEALGASRELVTAEGASQAGRDWWADKNFAKGTGMSDEDAEAYANSLGGSKQYGGVVPGPYGSPVPIMAHGGEQYEGMGAHGVAMTAVRAAEAMLSRGIGGRPATSNHTEFNVNANYGRVQSEGSLMRDLSALVTLTK